MVLLFGKKTMLYFYALHHNVLQITVKRQILRLGQRARVGHHDERMAREARVVGRVYVSEGGFRESSALVEIFAVARDFVNRRVYFKNYFFAAMSEKR